MSIADDLQKMLEEQKPYQTDGLRQAMALHKKLLSQGIVRLRKYDLPMMDVVSAPPPKSEESNWLDKRDSETTPLISAGLY